MKTIVLREWNPRLRGILDRRVLSHDPHFSRWRWLGKERVQTRFSLLEATIVRDRKHHVLTGPDVVLMQSISRKRRDRAKAVVRKAALCALLGAFAGVAGAAD